jgi:hypothetical protein
MRAHQIADMDVVADAGAVRRRVVCRKPLAGAQPESCLDRDLDQMLAPLLDCPVRPRGSAPATLKYRKIT